MNRILLPALLAMLTLLGACSPASPAPSSGAQGVNANAPMPTDIVNQSYAAYTGEVGALDATNTVVQKEVAPVGTAAASTITQGNPPCPGFIEPTPSYIFELKTPADALFVYFEANYDSTMMIITPDNTIDCADNVDSATNLNPLIKFDKPAQGKYGVFVGRVNMQDKVAGTVTATTKEKTDFKKLAP